MNEIVTLSESLIPLINELRHTTENDRRIAEPIVQAIRKSDLCRMLLNASPTFSTRIGIKFFSGYEGEKASRFQGVRVSKRL